MSDTREYIIDHAYKLFLNKSYEAVSISEISKAMAKESTAGFIRSKRLPVWEPHIGTNTRAER